MNNTAIKELKEITRQYCELLRNYPSSLDDIIKSGFNNNNKVTKENFEDFLEKIKSNDNKIDAEYYLIKSFREIKEIFKNDIDMIFPFYQLCDIQIKKDVGHLTVMITVEYSYKGKAKNYKEIIPFNIDMEKHIASLEATLNLLRVI